MVYSVCGDSYLWYTQSVVLFQIQATKDHFKARRQKAKAVFDDIRQHLERRYQEVIDQIQADEDASLTSLADHDKLRAALTSHAGTSERMLTSAGDVALLQVTEQLTSRLNDMESRGRSTGKVKAVGDLKFNSKTVSTIKSAVSKLGKVRVVLSPVCVCCAWILLSAAVLNTLPHDRQMCWYCFKAWAGQTGFYNKRRVILLFCFLYIYHLCTSLQVRPCLCV